VQVLMLSGNKLSEWPATVLASLPVLQELSLAQNPIAEVFFLIISFHKVDTEAHQYATCQQIGSFTIVSWVTEWWVFSNV
jgi:Leucine-rich repeat (LRR) protein